MHARVRPMKPLISSRHFWAAGILATMLLLACSFSGGDRIVIPAGKRKMVTTVAYVDSSGMEHLLAEHIGKVVVVDVWATWCPPCRLSLPEIAALQGREDSSYTVLAISVDRGGWDDVRPFLNANNQMGLRAVLPARSSALDPFGGVSLIPTTLVIDRHGRLRERWSGYYEGRVGKALQEALGET